MVDGLGKGVKYAMFAANGVIFIGGLAVFAVGVWTLAELSFMERLLGSNLCRFSLIANHCRSHCGNNFIFRLVGRV
jgi:hypothetical protein